MTRGWAALALVAQLACSDDAADRARRAGTQLAAGLVNALEASSDNATPRLCASWPATATASQRFELAGATARLEGATLTVESKKPGALAAVADARASEQAVGRARELAAQFRDADVRVVVAVGGMGRSKEELAAALAPLVDDRWALVAMPGDRESVPGLRAAIAGLAGDGQAVLDGTAVRVIELGALGAVTLPGVASDAGLAAGPEGCVHRLVDIERAASELASHDGPRLFLSYAAPRQRGDSASDLADGIHAGEPELAEVGAESRAHLVLHGQIELGPRVPESGRVKPDRSASVAIGALERSPALLGMGGSTFAGVIATPTRAGGVRWRRTRPVAAP